MISYIVYEFCESNCELLVPTHASVSAPLNPKLGKTLKPRASQRGEPERPIFFTV